MSQAIPYSMIAPDVELGENVKIFGFVNLYGCRVGADSRIGVFVEIQRGAVIGARVKIQSHTFICEGVTIKDDVFIGHGVMFINDRYPRSTTPDGVLKAQNDWVCEGSVVKQGASLGSNCTILCGVVIGEDAIIGAGSVVTHDVPSRAIVAGSPAKVIGQVKEGL